MLTSHEKQVIGKTKAVSTECYSQVRGRVLRKMVRCMKDVEFFLDHANNIAESSQKKTKVLVDSIIAAAQNMRAKALGEDQLLAMIRSECRAIASSIISTHEIDWHEAEA